ncbi:MAG: HNH endonuclease [Pseudonocardia sp.]|nr:HNH endonuclease [Pseudonocardia sp.]
MHHIVAWEDGGQTALGNCTMLCRAHRLVHSNSGWAVLISGGLPEISTADLDRPESAAPAKIAAAPRRRMSCDESCQGVRAGR